AECSLSCSHVSALYFFFQAEDGIRDWSVTGVQTCALPISVYGKASIRPTVIGPTRQIFDSPSHPYTVGLMDAFPSIRGPKRSLKIGRASCRERVEIAVGGVSARDDVLVSGERLTRLTSRSE